MSQAVGFFGEEAVRKARQVVPLQELNSSEQERAPESSSKEPLASFRQADLRRFQAKAVVRALLVSAPLSAIVVWLVFEVVACAAKPPDGPPAPTDLFAAPWVIVAYLIVFTVCSSALFLWWFLDYRTTVRGNDVLALIYRGERTNFSLSRGTYFLPADPELCWEYCRCHSQMETTVSAMLPTTDGSKVTVKYYLRWRVVWLWQYIAAGNYGLVSNQISRAVQERLRRYFAVAYEGPQTVAEALGSYDEIRHLIRETVDSLQPLGITILECRVLEIETASPDQAQV